MILFLFVYRSYFILVLTTTTHNDDHDLSLLHFYNIKKIDLKKKDWNIKGWHDLSSLALPQSVTLFPCIAYLDCFSVIQDKKKVSFKGDNPKMQEQNQGLKLRRVIHVDVELSWLQ